MDTRARAGAVGLRWMPMALPMALAAPFGRAMPIVALLACALGCSSSVSSPGTGTSGSGGGGSATGGAGAGGTTPGGSGGRSAGSGGGGAVRASGGAPSGGTSSGGGPGGAGAGATGGGPRGGTTSGGSGVTGGAGSGVPSVSGVENSGADCPSPAFPAFAQLPSVAGLPDPFLTAAGRRITSRAEWRCRRAEIGALIQHYELGTKPSPPNNLTATFAGSTLTVNVTAGGGSLQLTSTITLPTGAGPFPAVIGVATGGTGALPGNIFTSRGIATITFSDGQIAPQFPNRGQGAFYGLYPDPKVGSMIAWAWGISRIIDGLERTAAQNHVDLSRLAVTGCSYAGKIALYAGAFDERIALTIPEESGGGGEAAWRVSQTLAGMVENLSNAQGTAWYFQDLTMFNAAPDRLPFDQHELAALVAPRALLTIGNPDIAYLASEAGYVSIKAASEVWKAMGVPDRIGYSQVGGHAHCAFPASQTPDVAAFVEKFLVRNASANTGIATSPYQTDLARWVTWQTPALN